MRVMKSLRELGNTLCVVKILDSVFNNKEVMRHMNLTHFYGITSSKKLFFHQNLGKIENFKKFDHRDANLFSKHIRNIAINSASDPDFCDKAEKIVFKI
ncbi:hypothetical protein MHBO_004472 [Bonamia ostreae]|uniref:Uncharacterized protein n=1 Tax=Bonamia ostreae TaxID=126728 RepID=A0ABV2ATF2_9EUKA